MHKEIYLCVFIVYSNSVGNEGIKQCYVNVIKFYLPLLCLFLLESLFTSELPTARSVSGPSWGPVLHPQLGIGKPSGPVGHGASRPGGPGAPWSPFLPLFPFFPGSP